MLHERLMRWKIFLTTRRKPRLMTKGGFGWEHFGELAAQAVPSRAGPRRKALVNLAEAEKTHGQGTRESGNESVQGRRGEETQCASNSLEAFRRIGGSRRRRAPPSRAGG